MIRIENLVKRYRVGEQEIRAVDGINLTIAEHEFVAIMGPSGSGKSTLMNILGCLDTPSGGRYLLDGADVGVLDDAGLARIRNRKIGFVFQSFNLLPRYNALENVAFPLIYSGVRRSERLECARIALESVGLSQRVNHLPGEMSGGQRQRVAIARALVTEPSIILADEPTGNLDSRTSEEIMALFAEIYGRGNTIILVTHEEDIAQHARRVICLRDGRIESDRFTVSDSFANLGSQI
ncbi:MAG: ABC transporter ATP-binding protein [Bacteroidales bacterium]|nr:ABC transporter ATP-binding protein [Bacteroidales bacterium]